MTSKNTYLTLQQTEGFIVQAAARIYSAYIQVGKDVEGNEAAWMKKSIKEAITIAKATDDAIIAEGEMG